MYIEKFSFHDKVSGWRIDDATFGNLSLLVGVSGVGKTRILDAIKMLGRLVRGESFNGIAWKVEFQDTDRRKIVWTGETEISSGAFTVHKNLETVQDLLHTEKLAYAFSEESIRIDDSEVTARRDGETYFEGKSTVKLAKDKSLFFLLKEDVLSHAAMDFYGVISCYDGDWVVWDTPHYQRAIDGILQSCEKGEMPYDEMLNTAVLSELRAPDSLLLLWRKRRERFRIIKEQFCQIFSFVADIRYTELGAAKSGRSGKMLQHYVLQLQEKNADSWVNVWDFSSGMLKTLSLLVGLHTAPTGSLFLIDEFENSFGVNCIDSVTEILLERAGAIQFIITSHHPYIINKIPIDCWKLVTRKGSTVSLSPAAPYLSTFSKHQAFTQLLNLEQYTHGITA